MIRRYLATEFHQLLAEYPVVTLLSPRQAGKTTLAKSALPDFNYYNLEHPETRQLAMDDPLVINIRGFIYCVQVATLF